MRDHDSVSGYHQEITVFYLSALCFALYGHVARGLTRRVGDLVHQGDLVAKVGSSYDAMGTTPHAHVQVWKSRASMQAYSAGGSIDPQRLEDWYSDGRK